MSAITLFYPLQIATLMMLLIALLVNNGVKAEQAAHELPPNIIYANSLQGLTSTASSESFISREDIEIAKEIDINALLYTKPSVIALQNKSSGFSLLSLRGASGGQGLVTFDGVPVFANFSGLYSLRHFPRDVIQNIHVERGFDQNNSSSRTLGGAIHLKSRRVDNKQIHAYVEGGSQATINSGIATGLGQNNENISLVFGYTHIADGTTQSSVPSSIDDPDNFKMGRVLLRADKSFERGSIEASVYYVNAQEETDGPGLTPDFKVAWLEDPNGWFSDEVVISQVKAGYYISPLWHSSLQLAYTIDKQDGSLGTFRPILPQGPFSMNLTSQLALMDWHNTHKLMINNDLIAGIEWGLQTQYQTARTTQDDLHEDQLLLSPNLILSLADNHWRVQIKSQWDSYSDYGDHLTYAFGGEWRFLPSLTIWGNTGTRYRAPAVNEHLHPLFGNPDLVPEQSMGGEMGLNWLITDTRIEISGYFQHYNNLIALALDSDTGAIRSNNIQDADVSGVDFSIGHQWLDNWHSTINYSYMNAKNQQTGKVVPGHPEHRASLINNWQIIQALSLRLVLNMHSGLWYDTDNLLFSSSVFRLNALINYQVTDHIQLYFRAENLADDTSSEAYNFTYPQRSYYLGTELSF